MSTEYDILVIQRLRGMIHTINVFMKDLPYRLKAVTTANSDGTYTIFINSRLSLEQQQQGYIHELEHILRNDFDKTDANIIEFYAHKKNRSYSQQERLLIKGV